MTTTGDFDCDGYTDVAVGSPEENSGKGRVYIYLGNANGVCRRAASRPKSSLRPGSWA